ncbi:D-glycero-alpha-D-manno-heptose-1,7-bisphosphate 7-phosphatase [Metallibacterium scheffleri]
MTMPAAAPRPALFLDRDGVVNVNHGYVHRAEDTQFVPGIFELCRSAQAAGCALVIVTNQAGIARGYYNTAQYHAYSGWLRGTLAAQGVLLDGIYHCPHHQESGVGAWRRACACRKPAPGMILQAARDLGLDLARSAVLGDSLSDIEAGRRAGVGLLMMLRADTSAHPAPPADVQTVRDLADARATLQPWFVQQNRARHSD